MKPDVSKKVTDFFSKFPKRSYVKGQIIVFADETPEHIFYITKGKVRQYDVSYRGDEVVVNIFKPPSYFPMSLAINKSPNKYFYKTEEATELHVVPPDEVMQFLQANPDVMLDLLSRLYRGMEGLFGKVVHLMSGTAKSRLIYELIIECRRFGAQQVDSSFDLHTNEVDLAVRSGLSRETVSREIQKLKASNLIVVERSRMIIKDLPALEKLLGSEV